MSGEIQRDSEEDDSDSEVGSNGQNGSSFANFFNSFISGEALFVSLNSMCAINTISDDFALMKCLNPVIEAALHNTWEVAKLNVKQPFLLLLLLL